MKKASLLMFFLSVLHCMLCETITPQESATKTVISVLQLPRFSRACMCMDPSNTTFRAKEKYLVKLDIDEYPDN